MQGIAKYLHACANRNGQQLDCIGAEDGFAQFPRMLFNIYDSEFYALLNAADDNGFTTRGHLHKATGLLWGCPKSNIASAGWSVAVSSDPANYFVAVAKDMHLNACISMAMVSWKCTL
jgi:hypothetical protein